MVFLCMTTKLETIKEKLCKINYMIIEKCCMANVTNNKLAVNSFNSMTKGIN